MSRAQDREINNILRQIEKMSPERRSDPVIQSLYQEGKKIIEDQKKLADMKVEQLCREREERRMREVMELRQLPIDPFEFQKDVEKGIAIRAKEMGLEREFRRQAIAESRKRFKKEMRQKGRQNLPSKEQKALQDAKEYRTICTAISTRCGITFNGNVEEFLVDLVMQIHLIPHLLNNSTTDIVYQTLRAEFPEVFEAVREEIIRNPCPTKASTDKEGVSENPVPSVQQQWKTVIKEKVLSRYERK